MPQQKTKHKYKKGKVVVILCSPSFLEDKGYKKVDKDFVFNNGAGIRITEAMLEQNNRVQVIEKAQSWTYRETGDHPTYNFSDNTWYWPEELLIPINSKLGKFLYE